MCIFLSGKNKDFLKGVRRYIVRRKSAGKTVKTLWKIGLKKSILNCNDENNHSS